jgi:uncharacterized tellurite resistance protein B-like protein
MEEINTHHIDNMEDIQQHQTYWTEKEISELILYAKSLQRENEDLQAKMIMMNAKLENEESKVRRLTLTLKQFMNL